MDTIKSVTYSTTSNAAFATGLDELEERVVFAATLNGNWNRLKFALTSLHAVSERLGFHVEVTDEKLTKAVQEGPFVWTDCRYGTGKYAISPDPQSGRVVRFKRLAAQKEDRHSYIKESDLQGCYHYVLDPTGLSPIEIDLISLFLTNDTEGSYYDKYYTMCVNAAAEMARRLGLTPIFEKQVSAS